MVEEYRPREHNLRPHMLLEITEDIIVVKFYSKEDGPTRIPLKKGIRVTLLNDPLSLGATTERLAVSQSVRIDRKQVIEIEDRFLGRVVPVPVQYLRIHPEEL